MGIFVAWVFEKAPRFIDKGIPWIVFAIFWHLTWEIPLEWMWVKKLTVDVYRKWGRMAWAICFLIGGLISVGFLYSAKKIVMGIREEAKTKMEQSEQEKPAQTGSRIEEKRSGITDSVTAKPQRHGTEDPIAVKVDHPKVHKPVEQAQTFQAPYGNLEKRCKDMESGIAGFVEDRKKQKPEFVPPGDEYWKWYKYNDQVYWFFYYEKIKELQKDLATNNVKDWRLDQLVKESESLFQERQNMPQTALDHPRMFFLPLEKIEEIGERFGVLAAQVPN